MRSLREANGKIRSCRLVGRGSARAVARDIALPFDEVTRRGSGGASPYLARGLNTRPLFHHCAGRLRHRGSGLLGRSGWLRRGP